MTGVQTCALPIYMDEFIEILASSEIEFTNLGVTGGDRLVVDGVDFGSVADYSTMYMNAIGDKLS